MVRIYMNVKQGDQIRSFYLDVKSIDLILIMFIFLERIKVFHNL
jgi:hypothetical protein